MSVLPDMGLPNIMSEAEYEALPAGVARRIEVVHGYVIVCESPTPQHQQVARRLANRASDVLLMVEVSSPSTEREDLVDKMAQYAAAGIPAYVVVRMSADGDIIDTREFHLDAATCQYRMESLMEHGVVLTYPFKIAVPFKELTE
jgi:Uma2 family endonuclease